MYTYMYFILYSHVPHVPANVHVNILYTRQSFFIVSYDKYSLITGIFVALSRYHDDSHGRIYENRGG